MEDVFGFWDNFKTAAALVEACRNKLYPPRFNIEVSGQEPIKSTHFEVTFKGAVDELKTEIILERPTRRELVVFHMHFSSNCTYQLYTAYVHRDSICRVGYTGKS